MSQNLKHSLSFIRDANIPLWLGIILIPIVIYLSGAVVYINYNVVKDTSSKLLGRFNPMRIKKDIIQHLLFQLLIGLLGSFFYIGLVISSMFLSRTHTSQAILFANEQSFIIIMGLLFYTGTFNYLSNTQIKVDYVIKDLIFAFVFKIVWGTFILINIYNWRLPTVVLSLLVGFLLIQVLYDVLRLNIIKLFGWEQKDKRDLKQQLQQLNTYTPIQDVAQFYNPQKFEIAFRQAQQKAYKIKNQSKRRLFLKFSTLYYKIVVAKQNQIEYEKDRLASFHSKQFGNGLRKDLYPFRPSRQKKVIPKNTQFQVQNQQRQIIRQLQTFSYIFNIIYCPLSWLQLVNPEFGFIFGVLLQIALGFTIDILIAFISKSTALSQNFTSLFVGLMLACTLLLQASYKNSQVSYLTSIHHTFVFKIGMLLGIGYLINSLTNQSPYISDGIATAGFSLIVSISQISVIILMLCRINYWQIIWTIIGGLGFTAMIGLGLGKSYFFN